MAHKTRKTHKREYHPRTPHLISYSRSRNAPTVTRRATTAEVLDLVAERMTQRTKAGAYRYVRCVVHGAASVVSESGMVVTREVARRKLRERLTASAAAYVLERERRYRARVAGRDMATPPVAPRVRGVDSGRVLDSARFAHVALGDVAASRAVSDAAWRELESLVAERGGVL